IEGGGAPLISEKPSEFFLHLLIKRSDPFRLNEISIGLLLDGRQEEQYPVCPYPACGHGAHLVYVFVAPLLEITADIEMRRLYRAVMPQHQGDQHAPDPAIAVLERVQRLEFEMRQGRPDQQFPF